MYIIENIDSFKGEIPTKQIVEKHPQWPYISLFVIFHLGKYLWGHVNLSPTICYSGPSLELSSEPEISNFTDKVAIFGILFEKDILHFQIPVYYVASMDKLDTS